MEGNTLFKMPPEMLDMIFKNLSIQDKRQIRLTCKAFRDIIDDQTCYRVVLNNNTASTLCNLTCTLQVRSLVLEAFNRQMESFTSSRQEDIKFHNLEQVILAGRSLCKEQRTITAMIPFQYPYIAGETYTSCIFNHWMSMGDLSPGVAEENVKYILRNASDTITTICISSDVLAEMQDTAFFSFTKFPNLKTLEVHVVHHSTEIEKARVSTHVERIFDSRFPALEKVSFISLFACNDIQITQWIKFYEFLVAHRVSIQEVVLQHHFHFNLSNLAALEDNNNWNVTQLLEDLKTVQLKRLNLVLKNNTTVNRIGQDVPQNSLEMSLLQSQTKLEVLKFDSGEVYLNEIFEHMPRSKHLKACSIHIYGTTSASQNMDLNFLSDSKNLKVLQIVAEQDKFELSPWILTGVEMLPTSIEKLSLSAHLTVSDAYWIERNLTKLQEIRYIGGLQRARHNLRLLSETLETFNFFHFYECTIQLPRLKSFQLALNNNMIQTYLSGEENNVCFEVHMPFNNRDGLGHTQH